MNKKYLIMGASSDVGMAYIQYLLTLNEPVTVLAHYRTMNETFAQICESKSEVSIIPLQADLTREDELDNMLQHIKNSHSDLTHILHLPAEKLEYCKIKQINWEKMEQDFKIQILSLGKVLQAFLPQMAKRRFGKVVVMLSSVTLGMPPKFMTSYVVNKYALLGLMKSVAMEYGDKGVTVNGISPNMMETKFLQNVDERLVEMTAASSTLQRNVKIDEVIPVIQLLMSDDSICMNGTNINLSGGDR